MAHMDEAPSAPTSACVLKYLPISAFVGLPGGVNTSDEARYPTVYYTDSVIASWYPPATPEARLFRLYRMPSPPPNKKSTSTHHSSSSSGGGGGHILMPFIDAGADYHDWLRCRYWSTGCVATKPHGDSRFSSAETKTTIPVTKTTLTTTMALAMMTSRML